MLLYDSDVSGNCYKVRLLLAHLGLEYERYQLDVVDRSNREELLGGLNPGLRVPTLVLDDGRALGESGAILWYFGDGSRYVPTDPFDRAKVLQWMFFEQYSHEPYVAVPRFWLTKAIDVGQDALAERQRVGYLAFDAMEAHLVGHDYLAGGSYSIADIALYAYTHVADEGGFDLAAYPAIRSWLDRVAAQPGHVPIDA
jgi:glutathione S-transferase